MSQENQDIRAIRGVGDRLYDRIMVYFGGEDQFLEAVKNYEVDRVAAVEGVSQRRAVEIVNTVLNQPLHEFLQTDRALQLYDDIIARMLDFASTSYGKNRMLLLSPSKDREKIKESIGLVMKSKDMVAGLPVDDIRDLLRKVQPTPDPKPHYNPGQAVLVESQKDYHRLLEMDINRYCTLLQGNELERLEDFELLVYVYSEGRLELGEASHVTMIQGDSEDYEIVPETVLTYYLENQELLRHVLQIKKIIGRESGLNNVLKVLKCLGTAGTDEKLIDQTVNKVKAQADSKLKNNIRYVDLKGDEVLDLLKEEMPEKIQKIFDQVMEEAREEIKEKTGLSFDPFIPKYPIQVDEEELLRVKKQESAKEQIKIFEDKVKAAAILGPLRDEVEAEIREILVFDYEFALGLFAHTYDLHPPEIDNGFKFKDGLHLDLARKKDHLPEIEIQRINYTLQAPDDVVLLTGANSGGKTTLLETLAQISIMTHMGLPVCARKAEVELVDELYFFSKKRSLDAGAFESFLNTFMPLVTRETTKLILLDELEAITELEAAVKIISSFMDLIRDSESYAVIVTHMAREILKYTDVRVDGIEAEGLDENYNLIVDRTPRMNYFARSTPELILRRMSQKSQGKLKDIYREMLEKF